MNHGRNRQLAYIKWNNGLNRYPDDPMRDTKRSPHRKVGEEQEEQGEEESWVELAVKIAPHWAVEIGFRPEMLGDSLSRFWCRRGSNR